MYIQNKIIMVQGMNDTLNSIFVRIDVSLQNLSSKAIAQIIVKLLYKHGGRMKKQAIYEALANVNCCNHLGNRDVDEILDKLSEREIQHKGGDYYLSQSKKEKIKKSIEESEERRKRILEKYFSRLNTNSEVLSTWLQDATIKFFEVYSEEWISDLKANTKRIAASEDSIRNLITNRTLYNKDLDSEDKGILPKKFFDFVNTSEKDVDAYLWEYGTSAFSSKLIRTMHGVDQITIETFRNSHCILDTNILMFISLESRYKEAIIAIEKVFQDLGVKASIFYITKQEYEGRIGQQRNDTLKNIENLGYDIASIPNDDFTNHAKDLGCRTLEHFKTFFDVTLKLPEYIHDKVKIEILDTQSIATAIEAAQNDESLKNKLNTLFKSVVGHDKSKWALKHDIGLLEGARYLRNESQTKDEKFFILSEETSVNQYSRECGFRNGLPLALKVDTLINLLAVNNGGDTFNAADYTPLFANIIRMGLIPQEETFKQSELYQYYKMNSKIANLPKYTTYEIVTEMHKKMMDGMKEDELLRELNEMVTDGEIKANKALDQAKDDLYHAQKEIENSKNQNSKLRKNIKDDIKKQVTEKYDKETISLKKGYKRKIPLLAVFFVVLLICGAWFANSIPFWITLIFSVISSVLATYLCNIQTDKKIVEERSRKRDTEINRLTDEEFQRKIASIEGNA